MSRHSVSDVLRQLSFVQRSIDFFDFRIRTLIWNDADLQLLREQQLYHEKALSHLLRQLCLIGS